MCLYPKLILNPKYKANKKNGGEIPAITDERVRYVPIGCGNCYECKKQKARQWQVRLQEDIKQNTNGKFVTLTFSDKSIAHIVDQLQIQAIEDKTSMPTGYDLDNAIATYAVRHYLERWRKKYTKSQRHWLVTELGHNGTENIHLHGIIWTDDLDEVEKIWQYGHIWKGKEQFDRRTNKKHIVNYVNDITVNYIIKYVNKIDKQHPNYKSIVLTSPGIGKAYTERPNGDWTKNKYNENNTKEAYRTRTGNKISLPIYYRNKIYTEEEREKLWLQKLDKQERWVLGQRISIKDGDEQYLKALKSAQETNKDLGYGDDSKNWEQEQYERELRIIKQKQRICKAKNKLK